MKYIGIDIWKVFIEANFLSEKEKLMSPQIVMILYLEIYSFFKNALMSMKLFKSLNHKTSIAASLLFSRSFGLC